MRTRPPLTEVSRALRARNAEKVSKIFPGASGPGNPEKSPKSLGNSPKSLQRVSKESFRTVPETFWRLFGVPGTEAPGDIFETYSAFRARRARETSVRGGRVRN